MVTYYGVKTDVIATERQRWSGENRRRKYCLDGDKKSCCLAIILDVLDCIVFSCNKRLSILIYFVFLFTSKLSTQDLRYSLIQGIIIDFLVQ